MQLLEASMSKQKYTRDVDTKIDKSHPDYGKPQSGTWTAIRGEKANSHVHKVNVRQETDPMTSKFATLTFNRKS
jgi:hypothetical protein